jgi:hypothetical protein
LRRKKRSSRNVPALDRLGEVLVRRREHAHVDVHDVLAADARDLARLERAQHLGLRDESMSPISSRKSVPPCACSKKPRFLACAPVNAPRSWPKSSLSMSSRGMAAQLTFTNGRPCARATGGGWRAR